MKHLQLTFRLLFVAAILSLIACTSKDAATDENCQHCQAISGSTVVAEETLCSAEAISNFQAAHTDAEVSCH